MDYALLHGVAQIAARNRRRRVPKAVGAVRRRLVELPRRPLLELEPVHERLAPIVHAAVAGSVGAAERVDLRDEPTVLVQVPVPLVADLVIVEGELAEALAVFIANDGVPAGPLL